MKNGHACTVIGNMKARLYAHALRKETGNMAHIEMSRDEFVAYLAEKDIHVQKITPTRVYLNFEVDTSKCDPLLDPDRHLSGKPLYGGQKTDDGQTLREIINSGRKVEAIKAVRQVSGVGLKEAKDIVEANM